MNQNAPANKNDNNNNKDNNSNKDNDHDSDKDNDSYNKHFMLQEDQIQLRSHKDSKMFGSSD